MDKEIIKKGYYYNFYCNGTRYQKDIYCTNKKEAITGAINSCRGNLPVGNVAKWSVYDENQNLVAFGMVSKSKNGYSYSRFK